MNRYALILIISLLAIFVLGGSALAQDGGTVAFTNLSDGDTVSGLTTLTGTINFPDFMKYEIYLKSGSGMIWSGNSYSPVVDGNLVRLDPRVFNSGSYQIVVRKVNNDSNYTDTMGPTITINNPNGGALPYYPEVEPSFLYVSDQYALIRARNCAGEEFHFDYTSPQNFRSSGDVMMPGKVVENGICVFSDFAVIPGEYRGTAKGGAQTKDQPITVTAEAGKVYELLYLGGGHRIDIVEIAADSPVAEMSEAAEPAAQTTAVAVKTPTPAPVPPTAVAQPTKVEEMLPTTGNILEGKSVFALIALLLIIGLIVGGVMAARKQRPTV